MKIIYLCAALAAFQFGAAQTETKLKPFTSVTTTGDVSLTLVKGNEYMITGDDDDDLNITNENGHLKIEGDGSLVVYFKDGLEAITAGADTEVRCADEIKGKKFTLGAAADSEVSLKFDVKELHVGAAIDSEVVITGKAKNLNATIAPDAEFSAGDLIVDGDVTINLGSDGEAAIHAKGTVTAVVSADSELTIYGNPKKVNENRAGDAEITVVR